MSVLSLFSITCAFHTLAAAGENRARRGGSLVGAHRSSLLQPQSLRFHLISQRFVRSWRGGGRTWRRGRHRHHRNYMEQEPGGAGWRRVRVPCGGCTVRRAGSPESVFREGEEEEDEEEHLLCRFTAKEPRTPLPCHFAGKSSASVQRCRNPATACSAAHFHT